MNKPWKIVLVLLGIFIAGGVTGAFITLRVGRQMLIRRPGPEQWAPNHLKRLAERLDLKPEQSAAIKPIVQRNMDELNRLRGESMTEAKKVMERMEHEISAQLTPEQRTKFDQLNKELRERAKRFQLERRNRPAAPGGPRREPEPPPGGPGKPDDAPPPPDKPPGGVEV